MVSHVWSGPFPDGALYQLTPRVMIASPSFCLQQMSARRGLVKAIVTAMEICGEYARSPRAKDGLYRRPPLTTPEELRDHFAGTHGYGAKRARAALRHVVAGSRSPMETVVVLLFTLPVKLGG